MDKHKRQKLDEDNIPVAEFACKFGTDRLGDPKRRVVIMVEADSVQKSCLASMARRKGAQDEYVVQGMLNCVGRVGLVKAELKCDQEPSTMTIGTAPGKPMREGSVDRECNTKNPERKYGPV